MRRLSTDPSSFPACYQRRPHLTLMIEPRTLVLIPARMAATRLPGKPLLDIAGAPMIVHVLRRAEAARIGREAVMTSTDHPSGSDRIYEALCKLDPSGRIEAVINVQGDLPTVPPQDIRAALSLLDDSNVEIG